MTTPSERVTQLKLQQLHQHFARGLPQKMAELRALLAALERGTHAGLLQEMQSAAHKLAGSLGSFGFSEMSQVARALELHAQHLQNHGTAPGSGHPELGAFISRMELLMRAGSDSHTSEPPEHIAATAGTERALLLVEDDQMLAQLIREQLQVFGWNVIHCADASSAPGMVKKLAPDIVIVDVMLPEGDMAGLKLLPQLQRDDGSIPHKIILSSRWDWEARLEAVKAGIHHFFVKPVDINLLLETLDRISGMNAPAPYRVLLVNDHAGVAATHGTILHRAGMQVDVLPDPAELLEKLAQVKPELVLMNARLGACSGSEAARVIRQDPVYLGMPILFVGSDDGSAVQGSMDDIVPAAVEAEDLVHAVQVRAEHFRLISNLMRRDSLTGLLNHMSFKEHLRIQLSRTARVKSVMALAMLDIDHFKQINDQYGHPAGDRVLKALSHLLKQRLRKYDVVGRYGGEEFIIAFPDTALEHAHRVVEELLDSFARIRFFAEAAEFGCSFSAGIAAYPECGEMHALIETADQRLYQAKREGRQRIVSRPD